MSKKVMISAGETSGELYGALLSRELKKQWPDIEISGIGGSQMTAAGVDIIAPISHIIGILEVIRHLPSIWKTLKKAETYLMEEKPDVVILIDYPDFNLALAKKARAAGIPVLYYVSPQVWAWRKGRIGKIAARADRMAVLFPFEVSCYEETGLPCEFVGHPIAENLSLDQSLEEIKRSLGLNPEKDVVSLLPGSRPNELARHGHIIAEVAGRLQQSFPDLEIVIPLVPGTTFPASLPETIHIQHGKTKEALACSRAAVVASGTATLEAALMEVPMVVFYRVSPVSFHIAKFLASVEFISLANILSGKEVVRELLQSDANAEMIFAEIKAILTDNTYRENMTAQLHNIKSLMEGKHPSARVAEMTGELARWSE